MIHGYVRIFMGKMLGRYQVTAAIASAFGTALLVDVVWNVLASGCVAGDLVQSEAITVMTRRIWVVENVLAGAGTVLCVWGAKSAVLILSLLLIVHFSLSHFLDLLLSVL